LLYRDEAYSGYGHVLVVLAVAALAGALGGPATIALAAAERARAVALVTAASAVLSLGLIAGLLPHFGILGAAYGVVAAEIVGAVVRWTAFLLLVRDAPDVPTRQGAKRCL